MGRLPGRLPALKVEPNAVEIRKLEGRIRHYDWGSRRWLADLQGRPAPTARPEAELWFGAHDLAPAHVHAEDGLVPLGEWIARDPDRSLGSDVARRFGERLPFLVKILAVERPLSLQVHPDAERAREGFRRENQLAIPVEAEHRRYRDPHGKPELVCALERFTVLHGFRPLEEIAEHLAAADLTGLLPHFRAWARRPTPEAWRTMFGELLGLAPEGRREMIAGAVRRAGEAGCDPEAVAWVDRLARAHPGDVGALAPLLLRLVVLEPGQALFVPPGVLHAYLEGAALEAMASSDNVLRGGLTSKHVDRDELLRATDFQPEVSAPWKPCAVTRSESRYPIRAEEFALSMLELEPDAGFTCEPSEGSEILVCVAGTVRVQSAGCKPALALGPGEAAFVPAATRAYGVEGSGRAYRVRVPAPGEGGRA